MVNHTIRRLSLAAAVALVVAAGRASVSAAPAEPRHAVQPQQAGEAAFSPSDIPYEGAFGPSDPPRTPLPPSQTPLRPWVAAALDVLYERPSPNGPEPIAVEAPQGIVIEGRSPVIQVLPGPPAFPERIPEHLKTVLPEKVPFSNNVRQLARGTFRAVAYDRTVNDTKRSLDTMEAEIAFTDHAGAEWRIEQVVLAPLSPNPVAEPWHGGVVIDTLYHGQTGNGTPAEPLVRCMLCSWGWADVYKNGQRVASSALLHVMLTSDVRGDDFKYMCYECQDNPVREVHVIVDPSAYLPSPGGFLHVMWENAEWRRGPADEIARGAPDIQEDVPTIELSAVPYLKWDRREIEVVAGRKYRLLVHNTDPSSFHQFSLHSEPASAHGGGHAHGGGDAHGSGIQRHDHGADAGGIGPLWKPGEEQGHAHGDPPAPRNVFFALPQGATWATYVEFEKPGEYEFMCPVGNHYRRGMEGKFVVRAAAGASEGSSGTPAPRTRMMKEVNR